MDRNNVESRDGLHQDQSGLHALLCQTYGASTACDGAAIDTLRADRLDRIVPLFPLDIRGAGVDDNDTHFDFRHFV